MKILKYKLATETNHGTPEKPMMETVLSDVSMPYATEADYQLALSEAWQGEVTVEEVADTTDEIRARRDRLLAATDWAVLPDSPLDAQSLEAVKTYRQALRDVPQQERFPSAITWPQMPELANQPRFVWLPRQTAARRLPADPNGHRPKGGDSRPSPYHTLSQRHPLHSCQEIHICPQLFLSCGRRHRDSIILHGNLPLIGFILGDSIGFLRIGHSNRRK